MGYKHCDTIGKRGNPCHKTASKRDTAQGRIRPLIPKPTEQGLQSEDIEKRRLWTALPPDRTLDRERPGTPFVHLRHCLKVMVHHANPSAELRFEPGSLENSSQKPMTNPKECAIFYPLGTHESSADCLDRASLDIEGLLGVDKTANDKL